MIQDAKKKQIYLTNIPISSIVNSAIGTNIRTRNIYLNIKEKANIRSQYYAIFCKNHGTNFELFYKVSLFILGTYLLKYSEKERFGRLFNPSISIFCLMIIIAFLQKGNLEGKS